MNIQDAVKKALEVNGVIYRATAINDGCVGIYGAIKPTNTYDTCLLVVFSKGKPKKSCRCWNPTANDLIADDWNVFIIQDDSSREGEEPKKKIKGITIDLPTHGIQQAIKESK